MMPDTPLMWAHCGTSFPGWVNGYHPQEIGEKKWVDVCFSFEGNEDCLYLDCYCYRSTRVLVTNCGTYYVYYLDQAPDCWARYCGV